MVAVPYRRDGGGSLMQYFLIILLGFGVLSLWVHSTIDHHYGNTSIQLFQSQHFSVSSVASQFQPEQEEAQRDGSVESFGIRKASANHADEAESKETAARDKQHHEEVLQVQEEQIQKNEARVDNKLADLERKVAATTKTKSKHPSNDEHVRAEDGQALLVDEKDKGEEPRDEGHKLAGLDCSAYGGPAKEQAAEMVYWSDIPSDNAHLSPFYDSNKYMTFEPDPGGWNNIRMSMESVLAMAVAMGRTLVLPPRQGMYLLDKDEHQKDVSEISGEYEE